MQATKDLLLEEGYETTVTLRGVARRVGIAAPSIYAHFTDVDAIVQAVVVETFAELDAAVAAATSGLRDPRERLLTGCRAYITFGIDHVNLYRLLFDRNRQLGGHSPEGRPVNEEDLQTGPFSRLVRGVQDCIDAGISRGESAPLIALDLWVAMHGLISLRGSSYEMPWPERNVMEPPLILSLARIPG